MCHCENLADIRSMCEPECPTKNTLEEFNKCPARVSTMVFWIWNQDRLYEKAIKFDFSFLRDEYKMSKDDIVKVITEFLNDVDSDLDMPFESDSDNEEEYIASSDEDLSLESLDDTQ
jgi:hypothetical protein